MFQRWWHFSKSTQNSLPWVLPDKYITDRLTNPLILSLPILFSLFLPSTNKSLFEKKCNVLLSLMTNNSSMNRITMLDFLPDVKIPVLHISLFSAESGQASYRKVPCFTNKVLEWYKHVFQIHNFLDDKIRATVQLITYTVLQNCLSHFTIHHNSQFTFRTDLPLSVLAQRLSFRILFLRVDTWVRSDWVPM